MAHRRPVTNDVLLEKLNNQDQRQGELGQRLEKLETKITQNFESMAAVLKEGYINRDQFRPYEDWRKHIDEVVIPQLYVEISKRLHKDAAAPYLFVAKILGGAIVLGAGGLAWKIVVGYIQGGALQ